MEVYIDASPLLREGQEPGTLCTILIKGEGLQLSVAEAPKSRNELEAKYFALERALEGLPPRPTGGIQVYTDCWMLVNQLQGRYDVKDPDFLTHKERVEGLLRQLGGGQVHYIPKSENPAHEARIRPG